jgi:hypothetical protein
LILGLPFTGNILTQPFSSILKAINGPIPSYGKRRENSTLRAKLLWRNYLLHIESTSLCPLSLNTMFNPQALPLLIKNLIVSLLSVNCVLNYMLHYYLCVYFYGFFLCVVYTCLYIYGYFLSMLHVYVYCYFHMNLCIYRMYLSVLSFIYKVPQEFLCVYVLICIQFEKFLRGIAQLDVGDVTIWYQSFSFQH